MIRRDVAVERGSVHHPFFHSNLFQCVFDTLTPVAKRRVSFSLQQQVLASRKLVGHHVVHERGDSPEKRPAPVKVLTSLARGRGRGRRGRAGE